MKKLNNTLYSFSWLINLLLITAVFSSFNAESFRIYFNSDTLYLGSIYKDLFIDGTGFKGWYLNAAPNFFPDMFLYFIINSFFENFQTAYLVYSFVQYFIILILLNVLLKTIFTKINKIYLVFLNLIFPVILLVTLISNNFLYTYFIFSHSFHTGMFINVLLAAIFFFKYLYKEKYIYLWLSIIISFIGSYNDRIFLVMFTFPVLIIFILNFIFLKNKQLKFSGVGIILVSIVSLIFFKYTKVNSVFHCIGLDNKYLNYNNIIFSFNKLFIQHFNYIKELRVQGFITIITILSFIFLPIIILKNYKKIKSGLYQNKDITVKTVYFVFVLFSMLFTLISPALNGYYLGAAHLRYNIFTFWFGIFNLAVFLYFILKEKKKLIYILTVIFFVFNIGIIIKSYYGKDVYAGLKKVIEFYPEKVRVTDDFARRNNLKYGLGRYWDAKYTMMFSKQNIRVYTIMNEDLHPWFHVMNKNWYFDSDKGNYNKPVFNFVITENYDTKKIQDNFGIAEDSLIYKNETYILKLKTGIKYNSADNKPYLVKN